jgi:NAD(P)-dependent dehydrogenase (short-subunit alcohol dehydrogenase family)
MSRKPQEQGPKPPFPEQQQEWPGQESQMMPKPDYGEQSYRGHGRLKDKATVITGGDSGIGRAVALAFAREGADVLISYLSEDADAAETVRAVENAGRKAIAIKGDIVDENHCRKIIERALSAFGKLDVLVNNAAYQSIHENIAEFPSEEWDYTMRTNLHAMFYLSKAALPRMKEGGAIINVASIQAYKPSLTLLAYATTKGAIVTFTKALALMAIKQGVRVNAVAPGPVWTPLIPMSFEPQKTAQFGKDSPMERPAQPKEMAPIFVFLASEESSYVNGEVVGATGGKPLP